MLSALGRSAVRTTLSKKAAGNVVTSIRNSHAPWVYRRLSAPNSIPCEFQVTCVMTFMWTWIFYHCLNEPEHLYGHWIPPDPKSFTNEELGIPDIGDENPEPCDMRVRKERPRFLYSLFVDYYHERYGGSRVLPRRAAYANAAAEEDEEEDDE
jgi:hypothetical protein